MLNEGWTKVFSTGDVDSPANLTYRATGDESLFDSLLREALHIEFAVTPTGSFVIAIDGDHALWVCRIDGSRLSKPMDKTVLRAGAIVSWHPWRPY